MTVLLLLLLSQTTLHGHVVAIHDGDTVTVMIAEKERVKIRLAEIDAPELKQSYGEDAHKALVELIGDKDVSVDVQTKDRYGRSVGRIWLGERDVNFLMVSKGAAWCYRQYLKRKECLPLEEKAKAEKLGLWTGTPVPPWEWRKHKRMAEEVK